MRHSRQYKTCRQGKQTFWLHFDRPNLKFQRATPFPRPAFLPSISPHKCTKLFYIAYPLSEPPRSLCTTLQRSCIPLVKSQPVRLHTRNRESSPEPAAGYIVAALLLDPLLTSARTSMIISPKSSTACDMGRGAYDTTGVSKPKDPPKPR